MPQIVTPPDPTEEKEHPGFQIVRWLRPGGAALVLLLGILFVVQCLIPPPPGTVPGYQPPHDSEYYAQHLDELADELNENLLPKVDEYAYAEYADGWGVVYVTIPSETFSETMESVLCYYDESLFDFQGP
ncbi:MAG: hypothetical protein IJ112_05410 [Oscillospiraceae bacterium]|nr:hypothetical protein [Oscillospiraceae bacterium]